MTPTANRRHHTRWLVPGKLAVDETSNHCITTVTKMHVNWSKVTFTIVTKWDLNSQPEFFGGAIGDGRSTLTLVQG